MTEQLVPAFAQLPSLLYLDRRVRRGGRAAREVYVYALARNAGCGVAGVVPADEFELEHLADMLQTSVQEAEAALARAVEVGLLAREASGAIRVDPTAAAAPAIAVRDIKPANMSPEQTPAPAKVPDDALALGWSLLEYVKDRAEQWNDDDAWETAQAAKWGATFASMHRRRKIPYSTLAAALHWCQRDERWRAEVTTAAAFQKHYKAIAARRPAPAAKKTRTSGAQVLADLVDRETAAAHEAMNRKEAELYEHGYGGKRT